MDGVTSRVLPDGAHRVNVTHGMTIRSIDIEPGNEKHGLQVLNHWVSPWGIEVTEAVLNG